MKIFAPHNHMSPRWLIQNAQIPNYQGYQQILIEAGQVVSIVPVQNTELASDLNILDIAGDWISAGGVDLQINGALGLAFPELTAENADQLDKIGTFLWDQGVDGYCPTVVTTDIANIHRSLDLIAQHQDPQPQSAQILGVHLEGPCLNREKRGAHPAEFLQPLTINTIKQILGDYATIVKIITLAPELDPTDEVIPYLRSLGITVSLGHSQATAAQADRAFDLGATMVTHAFNAMPGLHHRKPGLLGAAIVHPQVKCGFIADGQHVCPTMLKILLHASDYDQGLFLVSDALSPLGLPDGRYPWDSREVVVTNGTARLDDGTLSGTALPLLQGVQNLMAWDLCPIESAIKLATNAPRTAIAQSDDLVSADRLLRWPIEPNTAGRQGQKSNWQRLTWAV
jgi:N-acetylglucosamine-6-phosphate deacetylase